jgi:Holliday junction DNA helicase RuvA
MIGVIEGHIMTVSEQAVVLQAHGVGFELAVLQSSGYVVEQTMRLFVHMHWNQDQGPSLYGFQAERERDIFRLLISCSGLGPKMGMSVLQTLTPESVIQSIQSSDARTLSQVNGIGAKKAEQFILYLKPKVDALLASGAISHDDIAGAQHIHDLRDVLHSLGYTKSEISMVSTHLAKQEQMQEVSFDYLMRKALQFLSQLK